MTEPARKATNYDRLFLTIWWQSRARNVHTKIKETRLTRKTTTLRKITPAKCAAATRRCTGHPRQRGPPRAGTCGLERRRHFVPGEPWHAPTVPAAALPPPAQPSAGILSGIDCLLLCCQTMRGLTKWSMHLGASLNHVAQDHQNCWVSLMFRALIP